MKVLGDERSGAIFSDDGRFRYRLWRVWDRAKPQALFTMLNPSKAGAIENDPTVERQERRVRMWGEPPPADLFVPKMILPNVKEFGGIWVGNAFPYVATDPQDMLRLTLDEAMGGDNLYANGVHLKAMLDRVIETKGVVVCGWGKHINDVDTVIQPALLEMLMEPGYPIGALQLNKDGTPCHPLYLSYDLRPRRWDGTELHEELI